MTGNNFALQVEALTPGLRLVSVSGELDLFAVPELKQTIVRALEGDTLDLIVDLTATDFIDSSGLSALILALKRARRRGGQMVVVDGGGSVSRTFQVAGLNQILTIVASREAAISELTHDAGG